jgi:hypothetical protein
MPEPFSPVQIAFGALVGFLPSLVLFYLEGRRARADRVRQERVSALDSAVGTLNKLLDSSVAALASKPNKTVSGVLPHDPLAYFAADITLIPDREAVVELTTLANEILFEGRHREDANATALRLAQLFVRVSGSARTKRQEVAAE